MNEQDWRKTFFMLIYYYIECQTKGENHDNWRIKK